MKKLVIFACLLMVALGWPVNEALCGSRTDDALGVAVSPQTFILGRDQGGAVTVHTAIRYVDVDCATPELNGIAVDWTHVDNRGNVVAEFDEETVKGIVSLPGATLTLTGQMKSGESFSGSDTVRVIR